MTGPDTPTPADGQTPDATTPQAPAAPPVPQDEGQRRLLYFLVGLLGIAALALLVLLIWLLWPKGSGSSDAAEGYPIVPIRSITGFGTAAEELIDQPLGAEFDEDGNIWISDTGNARVLVFDDGGGLLYRVGEEPGESKLTTPNGVYVDPETDRAYIADTGTGRVQVFTKTGDWVTSYPNEDQDIEEFGKLPFAPLDVTVVDGRVVVAAPNGIYFFDQDGNVIDRWGKDKIGIGYTQFNFPNSIDYDPEFGRYYVTDTTNKRVMALDKEGNVLWISGSPDEGGEIKGFWQLPRALTVGPEGEVYVVDIFRADSEGVGDGFIVTLGPDGQLVSAFGRSADQEDSFLFPEKIDYRPDGLWAIADREQDRVLLFELLPLPDPSEQNLQLYPASFFPGPFPRYPSPTPAAEPSEAASPSPSP